MARRIRLTAAAGLALMLMAIVYSPEAGAQRLLQRLQTRIQEQLPVLPPPVDESPDRLAPAVPPNRPQPTEPLPGLAPQRVAPVDSALFRVPTELPARKRPLTLPPGRGNRVVPASALEQIELVPSEPTPVIHLGVEVQRAPRRRGAVVTNVIAGSEAARRGFSSGDRILSIDGAMVTSGSMLDRMLAQASGRRPVSLAIERSGSLLEVEVFGDEVDGSGSLPTPDSTPSGAPDQQQGLLGGAFDGLGKSLGGLWGGSSSPDQSKSNVPPEPKAEVPPEPKAEVPIDQVNFDEAHDVKIENPFQALTPGAMVPRLKEDPPSSQEIEPPKPAQQVTELLPPVQPASEDDPDKRAAELKRLQQQIRELEQKLKALEPQPDAAGE